MLVISTSSFFVRTSVPAEISSGSVDKFPYNVSRIDSFGVRSKMPECLSNFQINLEESRTFWSIRENFKNLPREHDANVSCQI